HHHLKGASIWSLDETKQASWIWKAILKLRPLAERFLRCDVGNGLCASFWFDNWCPLGPLIKIFGQNGPRHIGIPLHAKLRDCCSDTGWILRPARSSAAENLQILLCSTTLPSTTGESDRYSWKVDGISLTSFSASHTWNAIRCRGEQQNWTEAIWFSGHIPSQAFHMWVAQLNRLPTRNRISTWDPGTDTVCLLCNQVDECRDHLFLRCSFSEQVWNMVIKRLGYSPLLFHTWTALIAWLDIKDRTCPLTLRRLATHTTVTRLWFERNNRLHNNLRSTPQVLFKLIDRTLRNIILARKNRKKFRHYMRLWLKYS
ncbi:hypothetical protein F2Q69_00056460, partial [Brassica cretica]